MKNGLIVPLFEITKIQEEQIKAYEKQVNALKEMNKFLFEKIKELDIDLYNELVK